MAMQKVYLHALKKELDNRKAHIEESAGEFGETFRFKQSVDEDFLALSSSLESSRENLLILQKQHLEAVEVNDEITKTKLQYRTSRIKVKIAK